MSFPTPLVSTQWLADHLDADDLILVDASVLRAELPNGTSGYVNGHESYVVYGHLPGAVFADLIDDFSDPEGRFAFPRPDASRFAEAAGALGIGAGTRVVIYDRVFGQWAARLWWQLRAFGFDDAAVLDGGWTRWTEEGRPTEVGHVEPSPGSFEANERPQFWASKADVEAIVEGADGVLLSANAPREFSGEEGRGHIPGSVNVPLGRILDRNTNTLLPAAALEPLLPNAQTRVVTYCNSGIVAAAAALALVVSGHRDVAVYDGSLAEWSADPDAPLETSGSVQTKSVHA